MFAGRAMLPSAAARAALTTSVRRSTINAYLAKVGLDDWKRQLPLGIFLAIPIIQHEVLILSEETQLVGCFCLFCGTAYQLGADSVAAMLDEKTKSVIAQHNAVEEQAIIQVKETVAAHEKRIETLQLLKTMPQVQTEASEALEVIKAMEFKHQTRDKFVKMLDNLVAKEEQVQAAISASMIAEAAETVATRFEDAEIKAQALNEAISILQSGGQSKLVPAMYVDYFKTRGTAAKDMAGTEVTVPAQAIAEIEDEIAAIMKRDDLQPSQKVTVPTSMIA